MTCKTIRAFAVTLLIGAAAIATGSMVSPTPSFAASQKITNPAVGKPLQAVQDLVAQKRWKDALAKLDEADAVSGKTAYETSVIQKYRVYIAVSSGDYALASRVYDQVLSSGAVSGSERLQMVRTAMQLAMQLNNFSRAIAYANELDRAGALDAGDRAAVANAYYRSGDCRTALHMVHPAIEAAVSGGSVPSQGLLELQLSCNSRIGDQSGMRETEDLLVLYYPSADHWHYLLLSVEQTSGLTDKQILDIYRLRLLNNDIRTKADFEEMAKLALEAGLPAEAKNILDKAAAAKLLTDNSDQRLVTMAANQLAQNKAGLAAFDAQARARADGEGDVKLGEYYWSYGRYAEAQAAIERGLKKGQLRDPDDAKIRLGLALLGQGRRQEALQAFNSIPRTSKQAPIARLWSLYVRH